MTYTITKKGNLMLTFSSVLGLETSMSPMVERLGESISTMELFTDDENIPSMIEWDVEELERTEHIGLWFEGKELVDYDGVFELPTEAVKLIRKSGYKVPSDML